jgi:endonuclease IV
MPIGVKVRDTSSTAFIRALAEIIDFIEFTAVLGNDYSFLREFSLPTVVHNMHFEWGVNFVNPAKERQNRKSLEFSLDMADRFEARRIIIHPERAEDGSCSQKQLVTVLRDYPDERISLETMPFEAEGCRFFGYDSPTMKAILDATGREVCLDFAHSSMAASALGREPLTHIKELMSLHPAHFHLSDTLLGSGLDMHLHMGEGDLPLHEFKRLLPKDAWVTLEVPHDVEKTKNDIMFLKG